MTNSSSNAQKGMFWQKVKSSVEMDIEPGILTVSLFRNDPTENFHYKRKFTILQSYGHAPCVCTSSTAKLFNVYLNEVKNGKHNRVEKHLESNEIALYSKGFGTWRSFIDMESPSEAELYQLKNPIRTIKGEKKFKLQFDMSKFLPKNVKVWMDSKNSCLTIDMHHTVDGAKYAYFRKIEIPAGVKITALKTSKHRNILDLEAPYRSLCTSLHPACWCPSL